MIRALGLTENPTVITLRRLPARAAALALLVGLAAAANGKTRAECEREYTPQRAQEGKDVMWAPTEDAVVTRMLQMAKVTAADTLYDLGAGDGKIPIAAAKHFGARAVGIEYDGALVQHARCLATAEGVEDRVQIIEGDIFAADFSRATVVTLYLLPALNLRLRPTLLAMKPGTRVVSYSFTMGDWDADEFVDTDEGSAYLWIVPAKVDGAWTFVADDGQEHFEATLEQTFQVLRGSARGNALHGKVGGERVEFSFVAEGRATTFAGTLAGGRLRGVASRDGRVTNVVGTRR
jgi:SAM-dependent methyltransferase